MPATSPSPDPSPPPIFRLGAVRLALLVVWFAASFGLCWFARDLPQQGAVAYAWAGQGVLIVFIVLVIANAVIFNRRDAAEAPEPDEAGRGA
ncbi:sodium/substrate symporter small subunit [Xylophilus sp. GOD-11R]|uniref:sodium/substrate symporter small subunit n=1 Tax=Xylophilus sp. GOD-11R TaxID=3089814 RepID=UPI00298C6622|nr:sodium/substrate symporter small subunit [Xylophilus sp. GOD-11R]WPB58131.1 DUF4212 domain-containing protein [Xylophilus sp. GOD-11R]